MKKTYRKGIRQQTRVAQETLALSEVTHFLSPPLVLIEEWAKFKEETRVKRQQAGIAVDSFLVIDRLHQGDLEPFFQALRYDPAILASPPLFRLTVGDWFRRKLEDVKAQANLLRIGKELAWVGGGRKGDTTEEEKRQTKNKASSRSKAKTRWVNKFERLAEKLGDAQQAYQQTLHDFHYNSRIRDPHQRGLIRKQLIKELSQRAKAQGK